MASALLLPPGPKCTLLLGNMPEFNRDTLAFITSCHQQYGDIVRTRFLYLSAYFLFHPEYIEYVLSTNYRNFIKSQSLRSPFFRRLVGNGLVTSEGDLWRRQRRLAQPAFHRDRIAAYGKVMVDYTERMLATWRDGELRDIHRDMTRLTQNIVVKTLFNADLSAEADEIGTALRGMVKPFASQATLKWILDNRLPTPGNRRFNRAVEKIEQVIYRIIRERRASGRDEGDLLSMLLEAQDEDGTQMSDEQLRDEVMTLFLAGHETTALALSWAWYLLSEHPQVEANLLAELGEVLGGRTPSFEDLPRLRYTEMIIKESLRLYPPAYAVGRQAVGECEIGGYRVPAGTQLFMFQWVVQRDPRYFDRPEEFIPARWGEGLTSRLPKYAYFPFGGGPRSCIGNTFAMSEAVLLLSTISQRFHLRLSAEHRVTITPAMSLRPSEGIWMTVKKRSGEGKYYAESQKWSIASPHENRQVGCPK